MLLGNSLATLLPTLIETLLPTKRLHIFHGFPLYVKGRQTGQNSNRMSKNTSYSLFKITQYSYTPIRIKIWNYKYNKSTKMPETECEMNENYQYRNSLLHCRQNHQCTEEAVNNSKGESKRGQRRKNNQIEEKSHLPETMKVAEINDSRTIDKRYYNKNKCKGKQKSSFRKNSLTINRKENYACNSETEDEENHPNILRKCDNDNNSNKQCKISKLYNNLLSSTCIFGPYCFLKYLQKIIVITEKETITKTISASFKTDVRRISTKHLKYYTNFKNAFHLLILLFYYLCCYPVSIASDENRLLKNDNKSDSLTSPLNNNHHHHSLNSIQTIIATTTLMTSSSSNNSSNDNYVNYVKNNNYTNILEVSSDRSYKENLISENFQNYTNLNIHYSLNENSNPRVIENDNTDHNSAINNSISDNNTAVIKTFGENDDKINLTIIQQKRRRDASTMPDEEEYENFRDGDSEELDEYELLIRNKSAKGKYIGAPCDSTCDVTLHHVFCDPATFTCGCEKNYPVLIGLTKGCSKPKKLGEQCFYHETCIFNDEHSLCVQVSHNARCECADGFHSVSYSKPTKRVFCTQDLAVLTSDLPTLLGVTTGIAVLAGLICMVLHLFSKTKYPRHRNFGDANMPPPIMYSSDTVQSGRPSSRSSLRSSGSIGSYGNRRPSSAPNPGSGSKGVLVSTSRTGAARSAAILLISCHISAINKKNPNRNANRNNSDNTNSDASSCDSMTKHLQKQLKHQRQLLNLELSPGKNHYKIRSMLGINNGFDKSNDDDLNSLDNDGSLHIGALPTPASETPKVVVLDDQV